MNAIATESKQVADTAKTAVDKWAVAGTSYTQIKGGVITTGQIKSGDYVGPAVVEPLLSLTAENSTTESIAEVDGVKDVSGNGNHGQAFGGVEVVDSEMGKAFQFDGVNDYILDNSITYENATEWSFSAWVKKNSYDLYQSIYSDDGGTGNRNIRLGDMGNVGVMRFIAGSGSSIAILDATGNALGELIHWAFTFKSGEYMRIYKNGVIVAEKTTGVPASIAAAHSNRYIGRYLNYYFTGLIAHPKMFKRALSPSEIKTLYMFPDDALYGTFAQSGSSYDLDNASITTENFYSNETGAGIKGHIEADTGRIGRWNINPAGRLYVNVENFGESDPALEITADLLDEVNDRRYLKKVFLGWVGDDAGLSLSEENSILSTGVPQDRFYTTIHPKVITCQSNEYSTVINSNVIITTLFSSPKFAIAGDYNGFKFSVLDYSSANSQEGTLGVKTLTLAGYASAPVNIDSDNPKIVFKGANNYRIGALVFTDADPHGAPSSVSLVGNEGGEIFAAPRFRANAPIGPASVLLSGGINNYG